MDTPVVLFIFNRPETTREVFAAIRDAQPKKLLIIADGARMDRPGELEKCAETRASIESGIDWPCEVLSNYSEVNLGCGRRFASGMDWVFTQVEEAIFLEDDCVPDSTFFSFCANLLERYRFDTRVMHINGNNFVGSGFHDEASYAFCKNVHSWAWATWKRAWVYYDYNMLLWRNGKGLELLRNVSESEYEFEYWRKCFDKVTAGEVDTWDFQWLFACWTQSGLAIYPKSNLVSDIGCRSDAVNRKVADALANQARISITSIQHPTYVMRNKEIELATAKQIYWINPKVQKPDKSKQSAESVSTKKKRGLRKLLGRFCSGLL